MTCDLCEEKANVFLTQIIDGQVQKVNLCQKCAKEKGVTDPTGFALADLLLGIGNEDKVSDGDDEDELTCRTCGFTQAQFKKSGRLGCSDCYAVFGDSLESLLKAMHKGTRHDGKRPAGAEQGERGPRLGELEQELKASIETENFEEAARIRDEIHQLKKELARESETSPQE
ncbi:MAG: UvrB/UvrC motif-containing protein [Verrucomicrobiota bacterium]